MFHSLASHWILNSLPRAFSTVSTRPILRRDVQPRVVGLQMTNCFSSWPYEHVRLHLEPSWLQKLSGNQLGWLWVNHLHLSIFHTQHKPTAEGSISMNSMNLFVRSVKVSKHTVHLLNLLRVFLFLKKKKKALLTSIIFVFEILFHMWYSNLLTRWNQNCSIMSHRAYTREGNK